MVVFSSNGLLLFAVATLLLTALAKQKYAYTDLHCDTGPYSLLLSDCLAALQSSIPRDAFKTTEGGLSATQGNCFVIVQKAPRHHIANSVLSEHGQQAMQCRCLDRAGVVLSPGWAMVQNELGNAGFNVSWDRTVEWQQGR